MSTRATMQVWNSDYTELIKSRPVDYWAITDNTYNKETGVYISIMFNMHVPYKMTILLDEEGLKQQGYVRANKPLTDEELFARGYVKVFNDQ